MQAGMVVSTRQLTGCGDGETPIGQDTITGFIQVCMPACTIHMATGAITAIFITATMAATIITAPVGQWAVPLTAPLTDDIQAVLMAEQALPSDLKQEPLLMTRETALSSQKTEQELH